MNDNVKQKLRENTNKWIELDTLVSKLKVRIKQLEREKTMLSDNIIEVMEEFDIADLNISNQQIKYRVTKSKQSISKKFLLENLTAFYNGNLEKAIAMTDFLDSKGGEKNSVKLINYNNKKLITND